MKIIDNVALLGQSLDPHRGGIIGFVPTMGALHMGHIELVRKARQACDTVVVSIFVNPTQFNDLNDLDSYPRQLEADCKLLAEEGVDVVFAPSVAEVYPEPDKRVFDLNGVDQGMEGAHRPGHFNGVAQVVSRLFDLVKPTKSFFGQKDFQQVAVIKELIKQMPLEIEIITVDTVREQSGLAMSSRNALLLPEYLAVAPTIYNTMIEATKMVETHSVEEVKQWVIDGVDNTKLLSVIYFEIVDALTLRPLNNWSDAEVAQGCIAVQAGDVRLIDNVKFK